MIGKYFIVHIIRNPWLNLSSVTEKINLARDWYRISETLWVIYTTSNQEKWMERLAPLVKPSGNVFICEANPTIRQGIMPKAFWDWLRKEKK